MSSIRKTICGFCVLLLSASTICADAPVAMYLFPAGGQRGTTVNVFAGGLFLNKSCNFEIVGPGVTGPSIVKRTASPFFEGPVLPLPESQRQEDYPQAMAAELKIAGDAPTGNRHVRMWTSQGVTLPLPFAIGDLPEIVEKEIDGAPIPVLVDPPITINGRIYPRENVDFWTVRLKKGQSLNASIAAASLGSPLEAKLEVRDPHGRKIVESDGGLRSDPKVRITASEDGDYQVHVADAKNDGGPAFVYRLTLTTGPAVDRVYPLGGRRGDKVRLQLVGSEVPAEPVEIAIPANAGPHLTSRWKSSNEFKLDVDDLPEVHEAVDSADPVRANFLQVPSVGNGIISKPGEIDAWSFTANKGETYEFDLRANRFGSPLLGVLTVQDSAGKQLQQTEAGLTGDPFLGFTAPADGLYSITVQDRFRSRGGPAFAYRLRVERPTTGFDLAIAIPVLTIARGQQTSLKVTATRRASLTIPIYLKLEGLPPGVTPAKEPVIPVGQTSIDIPLKTDATAKIQSFHLRVTGTAYPLSAPWFPRPAPLTRTATVKVGDDDLGSVRVAVAIPTPFKIVGQFQLQLIPRGTTYTRNLKIERNDFEGPIEIALTDRQARHLQGAYGPPMMVPGDKNEFEFPVQLPPWMETARTCRVCVMGTAIVKDTDGSEHVVTFSSREQNEQIISVVEPERLSVKTDRENIRVEPGREIDLKVTIGRGEGLAAAATIEVIQPSHFKGIEAARLELPARATEGTLRLRFTPDAKGPFNLPLLVRAIVMEKGRPVMAETKIELVTGK